MKESSYHDPKMGTYCKVVRCLEEKFDGLELNHVLRKYNEAADALAKMASEQATVPPNIFVSDLYKPSIDYKEDGGSDPSPTDQGLDPEPLRFPSQRPWTSSPRLPNQMTCWIGVIHSCNASSMALCPQIKPRRGE